ncbi:hypothetical protein [Ferroacidibacillus organovorans]|uniref:Uncharacterized protein n=1 Tax=Ferroacidibacillus organovorans TaxID=1765683 RepID=A0A1V4ESH2_9BACL|nr:hypothetical protein [Ferroacidibacillus organovorans]OPG15588.1 hypothetical protein B2M26_11025 [Ferroacidibacillus organovorans]
MKRVPISRNIVLRIFVTILYVSIGATCAVQGIRIAEAGTTAQIPQLEGDGGGNFLFGILIVFSGIPFLYKPRITAIATLFSSLVGLAAGLLYQDVQLTEVSIASLISGSMMLLYPLIRCAFRATTKKVASIRRPKHVQTL